MQAMSRIELEAELSHMVDAGSLTVRNPFTLGPLAFKHGDVLANSVVTLDDMRPLLEAKGIKLHVERTWETFNRTLGNDFFPDGPRSEEHTSELQSLMRISYAVFCFKKKQEQQQRKTT